jgi:hypothetical protein
MRLWIIQRSNKSSRLKCTENCGADVSEVCKLASISEGFGQGECVQ